MAWVRRHVARSHCAPEYTGRAVRTCERHLLDGFRPQHATAHLCAVRAAARAVPAGPRCLRHEPHSVVHVAQLGGAAGAWGIERQRHELNFVAHNAPALLLRRKVLVLHGPASLPPHLGCGCCCCGGMRVQSLSHAGCCCCGSKRLAAARTDLTDSTRAGVRPQMFTVVPFWTSQRSRTRLSTQTPLQQKSERTFGLKQSTFPASSLAATLHPSPFCSHKHTTPSNFPVPATAHLPGLPP